MEKNKNVLELLTKRELEVFNLISNGKSTKEISKILNVKNNTVSTYKKHIELKTGAKNEIEIFKIAMQNSAKLIDINDYQPKVVSLNLDYQLESKFY